MIARRLVVAASLALGVLVTASACTASTPTGAVPSAIDPPAPTASPTTTPTGAWAVTGEPATLAQGLDAPWSVAPLAGGGALVSERGTGAIREVVAGGALREVGIVPGVVAGGESGLHGIALHEDWLYAYHGAAEDNRVVRMPLVGEEGALSLGDAEVVFAGIPRANTHDGGRIAFGPDGLLYIATGDAQNREASQDETSLGGKILRVTPAGDPAPGNPFDSPVYSLGHRNVQGLAWTADGALWASEFGQNTWDELNRIEPGANYGWPIVEGRAGDGRFTDPLIVWSTAEASPSGIAAVGTTVFVTGLRGERLWAVDTVAADAVVALEGQGRLRDAVAAPDGSLWILTNNTDGRGSPRSGDDLLLRLPLAPVAG